MREKREKRAGRGLSSRAPRVSLAPKTAFPFPFIRLPRRLDQTVKKLIAFRSRKFIACHSKLSILNNAGVMWCAKESRMRVLMEFQSLGADTIKALSPNVFDRTAGIESKILPEDLRLYKDDLNVSKSHRYLGARP